jgi:aminopeptidase-like protein
MTQELPGDSLHELVRDLYPICRSITGDGVRETLALLQRHIPVEIHEVPSGTSVLDWTVPLEWNIRDAFIEGPGGQRIVDFNSCNLHVVSYSTPVSATMSLDELRPHLHTLPEQPDVVPYRTAYYQPTWGFCVSQRQLDSLETGDYRVVIDSSLAPGSLTYGDLLVPGRSQDEILISAHVCHPSLCDDNLSGIAVATHLARQLIAAETPTHSLRFVFAPATIGAITWLAEHRGEAPRIRHGLTLTCLGDSHPFTYKRTVAGTAPIDRAAALVLRDRPDHQVIDYFPYGYDERQYNSPGFRIPVGSLMRGRHGRFPEYHTSADNLQFVSGVQLAESLAVVQEIVAVVDSDRVLHTLQPFGEPQLGRRGLYRALGGADVPDLEFAMLWVLNQSDGEHSLLDIAERSGIEYSIVVAAARLLDEHELVRSVASPNRT